MLDEMATERGAPIEIAKGLRFDATAATQTFGVLARKRAGKTYLAGKLVEELHRVGCPVTVIDPVGNWWGLTLSANGKDPGLPFIVLGGEKGDIPLSPDAGHRLAEFVVERRLSSVLDVSDFDDEERARFVSEFLDRFLVCSKKRRQVHMMVFEEVHLIAPERHKGFRAGAAESREGGPRGGQLRHGLHVAVAASAEREQGSVEPGGVSVRRSAR